MKCPSFIRSCCKWVTHHLLSALALPSWPNSVVALDRVCRGNVPGPVCACISQQFVSADFSLVLRDWVAFGEVVAVSLCRFMWRIQLRWPRKASRWECRCVKWHPWDRSFKSTVLMWAKMVAWSCSPIPSVPCLYHLWALGTRTARALQGSGSGTVIFWLCSAVLSYQCLTLDVFSDICWAWRGLQEELPSGFSFWATVAGVCFCGCCLAWAFITCVHRTSLDTLTQPLGLWATFFEIPAVHPLIVASDSLAFPPPHPLPQGRAVFHYGFCSLLTIPTENSFPF